MKRYPYGDDEYVHLVNEILQSMNFASVAPCTIPKPVTADICLEMHKVKVTKTFIPAYGSYNEKAFREALERKDESYFGGSGPRVHRKSL